MSTQTIAPYGALTARDLSGFDAEPRALVLDAIARGATGRLSNRGHVILRSPDGVRTAAVQRKFTNNRGAQNSRAGVERLFRDVPLTLAEPPRTAVAAALAEAVKTRDVAPEPEPAAPQRDSGKPDPRSIPDGVLGCADCNFETLWKRGLARHRQTAHGDLSARQRLELRTGHPVTSKWLPKGKTLPPALLPAADGYACAVCGKRGATPQAVGGHLSQSGHRGVIPWTGGAGTKAAPSAAQPVPAVRVPAEAAKPSAARTEPSLAALALSNAETLLLAVRQAVAPELLAELTDMRLRLAVVTAERDEARRLLSRRA